jgi:hypothetical protein
MKSKSLLLGLAAAGILSMTGCGLLSPVPKTQITGSIGGQSFALSNPKDTTVSNLTVAVSTNGTASLSIGYLTSVNNSNVIGAAYSGQAASFTAFGDAMVNAVNAGATVAAKAAATAAK